MKIEDIIEIVSLGILVGFIPLIIATIIWGLL